MLLQASAREQ